MCFLFYSSSIAQSQDNNAKIKKTITGFLNWYKVNKDKLYTSPIILGFNEDTVRRGEVVRIDISAVEKYLHNIDRSKYVSKSFLNELRQTYMNVADTLVKHPLIDYFGPIAGLEGNIIFGFEPEEILDHIKDGKFRKIYVIYDKAIVKFDISKFNQWVFTLTKFNNRWVIDYLGYDGTNYERLNNTTRTGR
jgi:hypothetical protein